jgi:hypothetical protein
MFSFSTIKEVWSPQEKKSLFCSQSINVPATIWFDNSQDHFCVVIHQVEIYSRCYESSPLVIQGAGAGNDTTAAGVLADIMDLQDLFQRTA